MTYTLVVGAAPAAGHEPFYRGLLERAAHVVAADAAGEWCVGLGRVPDLTVGDFDSSDPGASERLGALGSVVDLHPAAKDSTDLELAAACARAHWDDPLVLTAAFTDRPDHTLAAFGALARCGSLASAMEPGWTAYVCEGPEPLALELAAGTEFSVLAVGSECRATVQGARWPLIDARIEPLSGLGVSNVATHGPVSVRATSGTLLVVILLRDE